MVLIIKEKQKNDYLTKSSDHLQGNCFTSVFDLWKHLSSVREEGHSLTGSGFRPGLPVEPAASIKQVVNGFKIKFVRFSVTSWIYA